VSGAVAAHTSPWHLGSEANDVSCSRGWPDGNENGNAADDTTEVQANWRLKAAGTAMQEVNFRNKAREYNDYRTDPP